MVVTFGGQITRIEEKPKEIFSHQALTGLYYFDHTAVERARTLRSSARGELEITDLIRSYVDEHLAFADPIPGEWFDTGTPDALLAASSFVASEFKSGRLIGSPERTALDHQRINLVTFDRIHSRMPDGHYRRSLSNLAWH